MGGSHGRFHTHPPPPERARLTPIRMDKFLRILLNGPTNCTTLKNTLPTVVSDKAQ